MQRFCGRVYVNGMVVMGDDDIIASDIRDADKQLRNQYERDIAGPQGGEEPELEAMLTRLHQSYSGLEYKTVVTQSRSKRAL